MEMSMLKPISGIGKAENSEELIATCEALGMKVVVVGHDTHRIKKLYSAADIKKLTMAFNPVESSGLQATQRALIGDEMEYLQDIHNKIAAHDTFNQLLEKKLTWVKIFAVLLVFLLFGLFHFVIHPRGVVFMTTFIPLLCIVIAARYWRRRVVMSSAEIWQYLDNCKDDKDFARVFIPLLLNCDYLTRSEEDILTQYIVNRSQQGRDAYERNILHHAIAHYQSED